MIPLRVAIGVAAATQQSSSAGLSSDTALPDGILLRKCGVFGKLVSPPSRRQDDPAHGQTRLPLTVIPAWAPSATYHGVVLLPSAPICSASCVTGRNHPEGQATGQHFLLEMVGNFCDKCRRNPLEQFLQQRLATPLHGGKLYVIKHTGVCLVPGFGRRRLMSDFPLAISPAGIE